jgi:hypothetical protein
LRSPVAVGFLCVLTWMLGTVASPVSAQSPAEDLRLLKAAFVFNFAKFTRWPESTWSNQGDTFRLCIIGDDELAGVLKQLSGRTIQGKEVYILALATEQSPDDCHILHVAESERERVGEILGSVKGKAILTVSDLPGFARQGGMIEMFQTQERVRFHINETNARRVGLVLNSRLLDLADIVQP